MARIKKELLEGLTNVEIKRFFTSEDWKTAPSPIREFIEEGKDRFELGNRINRVEKLLINIIIDRFISGTLDSTDVEQIQLRERLRTLSQVEELLGRKPSTHKIVVAVARYVDKEQDKIYENPKLGYK